LDTEAAGPPGPGELYDWECRDVLGRTDQDVAFWQQLIAAASPGPVLELACGTGRVSLPLAAAGVPVVGLDIDLAMLAVARARRGVSRYPLLVAADMRRFALANRFSVVIIAYNSLQLLAQPGDAVACLRQIGDHLAPDGIAALEVTDFQRGSPDTEVELQPVHTGQLGGRPLTLWGSLSHDLGERVSRYRRHFSGPGWTVDDVVVIRSYRPDELAAVLAEAGLTAQRWWTTGAQTRVVARPGQPG
jgi:SAM-dependent methyltransferase